MEYSLFIFGNGIGNNICPKEFSLLNAINDILNNSGSTYGQEFKDYVNTEIIKDLSFSEDDLEKLHFIADCISTFQEDAKKLGLLNIENVESFIDNSQRFIHDIGCHFFEKSLAVQGESEKKYKIASLKTFLNYLKDYMQKNLTHVATTNYDAFLYSFFIDNKIVDGYSGTLIDGLTDSGFTSNNLERYCSGKLGYYLHLHGSPLFYTDNGSEIKKHSFSKNQKKINNINKTNNKYEHIVLSHSKYKNKIIASSELLSTYQEYFKLSLKESNNIYIIGHGCKDKHITDLVLKEAKSNPNKKIYIYHRNEENHEWANEIAQKQKVKRKIVNLFDIDFDEISKDKKT